MKLERTVIVVLSERDPLCALYSFTQISAEHSDGFV